MLTINKPVTNPKNDLLSSFTPEQRHKARLLVSKFFTDYKSVASKRGTKNFNLSRWLNSNT